MVLGTTADWTGQGEVPACVAWNRTPSPVSPAGIPTLQFAVPSGPATPMKRTCWNGFGSTSMPRLTDQAGSLSCRVPSARREMVRFL